MLAAACSYGGGADQPEGSTAVHGPKVQSEGGAPRLGAGGGGH